MHSGKLVMETTADLLQGGAHGAALVPGKSAESRLIKMVLGELTPKMPLEGELKPAEIEILRRWIDSGAPPWSAEEMDSEPLSIP
ncbi:MAG: c-type cytochrome domain-containing protein, partial [Gammaproteobacteria bacterium]